MFRSLSVISVLTACVSVSPGQITQVMSANQAAAPGNAGSAINSTRALSDFGRWCAFASAASDLVPGDSNNAWDVFVRDRSTGQTVRVSVTSAGVQANGDSGWGGAALNLGGVAISDSGRFVVFPSDANNLAAGKTSAHTDIFVHDRDADFDGVFDEPGAISTTRVSTAFGGGDPNGPSWSPDIDALGTRVSFVSSATDLVASDGNTHADVFVTDLGAGTTVRVQAGATPDGPSLAPLFAGPSLVFSSDATNLVAGDTNAATDVFAYSLTGGTVGRLTVDAAGGDPNGPSRATDAGLTGRYIVIESGACDLLDLACAADGNGVDDIYLLDRDGDGDWVFDEPGDLVVTRVSEPASGTDADGPSRGASVSWDGLFVAFLSDATNLAGADSDGSSPNVFLKDLTTQSVGLVGVLPAGGRAVDTGSTVSLSREGGTIAFTDTNAAPNQALLRDTQTLDTDGDSLLDSWEIIGIDANMDGQIDLRLPPRVDAWIQDVIVEVDAMQGMLPAARTLQLIESTFGQQDTRNVQLTLIVDETNLPLATWSANVNPITWPVEFGPFKAAWFGTAAERASPNWPNIRQAKLWAHRYCVFAEQNVSNTIAGMAELPGNDMFLTLGGIWTFWGANPAVQLGVFLHELGHNLNLDHGGGPGITNPAQRAIEYKPNYYSVMNPSFTTPQVGFASSWPGNLSESTFFAANSFPPIFIDESFLFEADGLGGFAGRVSPVGPPPMRLANQTGGVDWDRDGVCCTVLPGVQADANFLAPGMGGPSPNESLFGHNDYANIQVQIGRTGSFGASAHGTTLPSDEYTYQDFQTLNSVGDFHDNFDLYANADPLYVTGGWETWCNGGADALVSDEQWFSPPHAARLSFDGVAGSDVVKRFNETSGRLTLSAMTYVPSQATGAGYLIALNTYCQGGFNWSMQVAFDATTGLVQDVSGLAVPLQTDTWVEFTAEIDLNADRYSNFYAGVPIAEDLTWSSHIGNPNGNPGFARLRAVDLFSLDITEMYVDDLTLVRHDREPPNFCLPDVNGDGVVDNGDIGDFVALFLAEDPAADFTGDGILDNGDIGAFVAAFLAGC